MVNIDSVLNVLLNICSRHLHRQKDNDARAVFSSMISLAAIYPPTNNMINSLYGLAESYPNLAPDLYIIENRFSKEQLVQIAEWKLADLNAKIALSKVVR